MSFKRKYKLTYLCHDSPRRAVTCFTYLNSHCRTLCTSVNCLYLIKFLLISLDVQQSMLDVNRQIVKNADAINNKSKARSTYIYFYEFNNSIFVFNLLRSSTFAAKVIITSFFKLLVQTNTNANNYEIIISLFGFIFVIYKR